MIYIPLNLDRLRSGITVLCDLLRFVRVITAVTSTSIKTFCSSPTPRPVQVPIGQLSKLCIALLSCDATEQVNELWFCAYYPLTTLAER